MQSGEKGQCGARTGIAVGLRCRGYPKKFRFKNLRLGKDLLIELEALKWRRERDESVTYVGSSVMAGQTRGR